MRLVVCWFCLLLACACSQRASLAPAADFSATRNFTFDDDQLQEAAQQALSNCEGAVLVIDPQTGRLRAVVNPRIAFNQAFPPGSTLKAFTTLAAWRAGQLDRTTQRACSGGYARGAYEVACSHPKSAAPFNLPQALAYSCNDYFGQLGERLNSGALITLLTGFGFGARTGVNASGEVAGHLTGGEWGAPESLGESSHLLVTPVQLLLAYTALVNGGQLFRPQLADGQGFLAQKKAQLAMPAATRAVLLEGMRGAVKYGTAEHAQLDQLPFYVFGKTGTSTASNGFQTQGWFVGFVADTRGSGVPAPEQIKLGILVLLKRSHGSQGAEVARRILEGGRWKAEDGLEKTVNNSDLSLPRAVRVKTGNPPSAIQMLPFEAYLNGVVAAEGSIENQLEALKAQAVISRTYALQNLGRHADQGFDFCSTTHCQLFRPLQKSGPRSLARRAVEQTSGEVLQDAQGRVAEVYFHAACGGQTSNPAALWGGPAPPHLSTVRDDFCAPRPNRHWHCELLATQIAQALRSEPRLDVGASLHNIVVAQRDASGRAQTLVLSGTRRKVQMRGWDFKLAVGRALGWHLLKSSRFEVRREGERFIFIGSGFGHGIGLCQEGAHAQAERGRSYRQILSFYFPGAVPGQYGKRERLAPVAWTRSAETDHLYTAQRAVLSSEHFRVNYPANTTQRTVEMALRLLEAAWSNLQQRLDKAALSSAVPAQVEIFVHASTTEFIAATGRAGWVAAVTRGRRIETQPFALLQRRGRLATTLKHELAHVVIENLSHGHAPRWLAEGLAVHCAGEGRYLAAGKHTKQISREELERRLAQPADATETHELYARAYHEIQLLLQSEGEAGVWTRVAASRKNNQGQM